MYTEDQKKEKMDLICNLIIEERMPIRKILMRDDTPSTQTFFKWLDEDETYSKQYARATEIRGEAMFEEILTIADDQEDDVYTDDDGVERVNHNAINRARLRVDTRKWYLSKINPKKFSERTKHDVNVNSEQPFFPDVPTDNSSK